MIMEKYEKQYRYQQSDKGKETQKKYLQSDKGKAKQKNWRQSEKGKKFASINNWKHRGIISNDYNKLYDEYINTAECALCKYTFKKSSDRCLDHNHETGDVRNILCRPCNTRDYKPVFNRTEFLSERRKYENTWGGRIDVLNNSLLKIDPNLFIH